MSNAANTQDQLSPLKRAILELRELRARLDESEHRQNQPIAIVGMGLRLPGGARDEESLWQILSRGIDTITEIPNDRWDVEAYFDADPDKPGKMNARHGAVLTDVDQFDAEFFGISPREAISMDPQHRLLMESAWEALENAAIAPASLRGSQTGVFVGIGNSDYWRMVYRDQERIDAYSALGNSYSVAAGRLSYFLGTHGPSMAIDTACSASLVAVHLACQSLRSRECSLALAGGVNLILSPEAHINFSKSRMLARDGRCKTFDATADGYVRGEGCGVVVLKPLSAALTEGNRILAVIRGSAVNQDGRSGGLTAPNGPAQEAVIRQALALAGIAPGEISYLEAHGTGTSLGDPIEVRAACAALCKGRTPDSLLSVGSIKTNIGHLEAAAGVAGLLKVIVALRRKEIPPHLHLTKKNPFIDWDHEAIAVPTELTPWEPVNAKRMAAISSFGFSGTNAHLIVEEAPTVTNHRAEQDRPVHILALSARNAEALRQLSTNVANRIETADTSHIADVCFTANSGRSHFSQRMAIVGERRDQFRSHLIEFAGDEAPANVDGTDTLATSLSPAPVAFLFTGQGAQYTGMARELYETSPTFKRSIDRCDELLRTILERPLLSILYPAGGSTDGINNTALGQPALFAIEYALAELWRSWGIQPAVVLGHSLGEYVAACVAGAFSLEDGLRLIAERGRLMQSLSSRGRMVAVFARLEIVQAAISDANSVSVAAINGPDLVVISGDAIQVETVRKRITEQGIRSKDLEVSHAFHSPLMEPILDAFEAAASRMTYRDLEIGFISNLTGVQIDAPNIGRPEYWRRHIREPVQFLGAIRAAETLGVKAFVEIGPNPVLLGMARHILHKDQFLFLPSLRSGRGDWLQMLESLRVLYLAGAEIDWAEFDRDYVRTRLALPTYPFQRRRYWIEAEDRQVRRTRRDPANLWRTVRRAALRQSTQTPIGVNVDSYAEKWACLERLTVANTTEILRSFGVFTRPGEVHDADSLVQRFRIPSMYGPLLTRWMMRLTGAGLLRAEVGGFVSEKALPDLDLPSCTREADQLLADDPDLLAYLRNCAEKLPGVMAGKESALETLFPGGSSVLAERLYAGANINRYANAIAAAAVEAASLASDLPRPLRILEIGAGTGATSSTLLPLLDPDQTEYLFTDVSELFLSRGQERFADFSFVRFAALDLEKDLEAQGFASASFDVIVAANVVHAARDLDAALRRIRRLMAPGGFLLLIEATHHHAWFDITTGLIEGWEHFQDDLRRDHPLLDRERWTRALSDRGFDEVAAFPEENSPAEVFGQHVILARTPQSSAEIGSTPIAPINQRASAPAPDTNFSHSAEAAREFRQRLESALPDERQERMIEYVQARVMAVLRVDADRRPGIRDRLMDLGMDSLMAVELRNFLETGIDLKGALPATLMFDYPTIESISDFLLKSLSLTSTGTEPAAEPRQNEQSGSRAQEIEALTEEEVEDLLLKRLDKK